MSLQVVISEHKYPRKPNDYSVWLVESDRAFTPVVDSMEFMRLDREEVNKVFCAHPVTEKVEAEIVAQAFRVFLEHDGEQVIRKALQEAEAA